MLFVVCFPLRIFFAGAKLNYRVFVHEFDNNMLADFRRVVSLFHGHDCKR